MGILNQMEFIKEKEWKKKSLMLDILKTSPILIMQYVIDLKNNNKTNVDGFFKQITYFVSQRNSIAKKAFALLMDELGLNLGIPYDPLSLQEVILEHRTNSKP